MEFTASTAAGTALEIGTQDSTLKLPGPEDITFRVNAAMLMPTGPSGKSPVQTVELIVNGYPVARQDITADGLERPLTFTHRIEQSSWAAVRVMPSAHTNPVFILVNDRPIRANRQSAEWCLRVSINAGNPKPTPIALRTAHRRTGLRDRPVRLPATAFDKHTVVAPDHMTVAYDRLLLQ